MYHHPCLVQIRATSMLWKDDLGLHASKHKTDISHKYLIKKQETTTLPERWRWAYALRDGWGWSPGGGQSARAGGWGVSGEGATRARRGARAPGSPLGARPAPRPSVAQKMYLPPAPTRLQQNSTVSTGARDRRTLYPRGARSRSSRLGALPSGAQMTTTPCNNTTRSIQKLGTGAPWTLERRGKATQRLVPEISEAQKM